MSEPTEPLRQDIEQTRSELSETVDALAYKADVKSRAQDKKQELKTQAQEKAQELRTQAQEKAQELRVQAQEKAQELRERAPDIAQTAKAQAQEKAQRLARLAQQKTKQGGAGQSAPPVAVLAGVGAALVVLLIGLRRWRRSA